MAGEVTFTPTKQDYMEANHLWARSARQRRLLFWIAVAALALAGVETLFDLDRGRSIGATLDDVFVILIFALLVLAAPLISSRLIGRSVARMFAQRPSMADPIRAVWDDEKLVLSASSGVTNQPWSTLHRWIADDRSIVFLPTDRMMLLIPTRSLSAEQVSDLRDTAGRHRPPMGRNRA